MSTIGKTSDGTDRRTVDRRLFTAAAIIFVFVVVAGFARTYYLKAFFNVPPIASTLVHVHGLIMSSWVALFFIQVWLISARRVRLHRRLGLASIGLALLIIGVGFFTALHAAKFGAASAPRGIPRLSFLLVPLTDLVMFATFFCAGFFLRNKPAEHKRLMLLAALSILPPAVARIQIAPLQALGPLWFFGFPAALGLLAIIVDSVRTRRVNKVFVAGLLLLIVSFVLRLAFMGTPAWIRIAEWLTGNFA